jgi:hypothetical protein
MYLKMRASVLMGFALCTLAAFSTGCGSSVIYASDSAHSLRAAILASHPSCDATGCKFRTWVLLDRGFFIFVDNTGQVGISELRTGQPTRMLAPIMSDGSMSIVSNSMRSALVTGLFPDLGIKIILDSDLYLAKLLGQVPGARADARPTEVHFTAFIEGIGLLDGTIHGKVLR